MNATAPTPRTLRAEAFPFRILTTALGLTAALLLSVTWVTFVSYRAAAIIEPRDLRLEELRGRIVHLDEVLTSAARLAAATGDSRWEQRYRHYETQLDTAISEAVRLTAGSGTSRAAAQTAAANGKLVEWENQAFALIRAGQPAQATAILSGEAYETQKKIYAAGMENLLAQIRKSVAAIQREERNSAFAFFLGTSAALVLLLYTWLSVWRRISHWRAALAANLAALASAKEALQIARDELERRVDERTRQLANEVAERTRATHALQASEEFLQSVLANAPVNIFRLDAAGRFVYVNERFCRASGRRADEILGRTATAINLPEAAARAQAEHEEIMRTGQSVEKEESQVEPDGTLHYLQVVKSPVRDAAGKIVGTQCIQFDITERKRAEEALRASEERIRTIASTAQDAIIMMDNEGDITFWNEAAGRIFGHTETEALGRNLHDLLAPEHYWPAQRQAFPRWQATGAGAAVGRTLELTARRKDGAEFPIELALSAVRIHDRWTAVGILRDITARKQAEQELLAAKEAAETAARAKSEFLANMSHEIRTPMNGVIGMTGLLLDTRLDPEQRQFAESVRNSAEALMTVINDILDFSKIEAGKLVFEELDFDLVETIEGTLDMLAERAQGKGIELIDSVPPTVPARLRGDPGRLRQVFINLLGNAIKFTERGEVVLRVACESETPTHAVLRFQVTDTGIGIPRQAQERLFQSFQQADNSTARKYGGTGLGLAISKQLVHLMHGEIGVQSEAGKGTTFTFTARFEKQSGEAKPTRAGGRDLFDLRVLVVDDNATNRQVLRHQIFAWKMQKGSAASGYEALRIMRAAAAAGQPYDLALLDLQMPEMDGLTLARAIKDDPALAPTRLIILTSLGHGFTNAELRAAGIDAYLVKPIKQSRLFDTLVNVVGSAKAERALTESPPAAPAPPAPAGPALRVLVAEDNPVNQQIASAQLKRLGCSVDVVANGHEVLEALPRAKYDLVFMDCQMPEMDGYVTAQTIRKREQEAGAACRWKAPVPIIAMTAHAMVGDREKCLAAGMDDYVSKPVRMQELQAALLRALPKASGEPNSSLPP